MGPKTVLDFMPIWIKCSLKQKINIIIRWIEIFGSFPYKFQRLLQVNVGTQSKSVGYFDCFWKSYFIFKYPPVLHVDIN